VPPLPRWESARPSTAPKHPKHCRDTSLLVRGKTPCLPAPIRRLVPVLGHSEEQPGASTRARPLLIVRPTLRVTYGADRRGDCAVCNRRDGPDRQVDAVVRRRARSLELKIAPSVWIRGVLPNDQPSVFFSEVEVCITSSWWWRMLKLEG